MKLSQLSLFSALALLPFLASCAHRSDKVENLPDTAWPFFQSGIEHHAQIETDLAPTLGKKWMKPVVDESKPFAPQEYSSPAAAGGMVFFASLRGKGVTAYRFKTGELIWHFKVDKGVESSPAFYEERLYFGANDGHLYAVDAKDGTLLWQFYSGAEILSSPIAEGGMVFFSASNDILYALDAVTGEMVWRYKGAGGSGIYSIRLASSPAYHAGNVYAGFSDGTIVAVVAFDGSLSWKRKLSTRRGARFTDIDASPVVDGKVIYVASYDNGFYALDLYSGDTLWKFDATTSSTPSYDESRVYGTDSSGKIFALDKKSGDLSWEYDIKKGVPTSTIIVGNFLIFGSSHKKLYLLRKDTGEVVKTVNASSGFSAPPIYYREMIYAISNAGYIYALN